MPVYIDQPDAFERICQVENEIYENYGRPEVQKNMGCCSFSSFKKVWEEAVGRNPELKTKGANMGISVDGNGAIYGAYGYNRYTVRYSGEILFIRALAINSEFIAKAEKAGFRIF